MFSASKIATLIDVLEARASEGPSSGKKTAFTYLEDGERVSDSLTFAALERRARSIAAHLRQSIKAGDRVLLIYPPGLEFIAAFWGCVYAGAIAVPAVPPTNARNLPRLEAIAGDARPVAALLSASVLEKMHRFADRDLLSGVRCYATDTLPDASASWDRPELSPKDIAFLQYTSGSTGTPKGVMVSHSNVLANVELIQSMFPIKPGDVIVSWLPPHHDMGLIGKMLLPVSRGAHCVQCPPAAFLLQPYRWLKLISDYRACLSSAPNFAYELCVQKISEGLRPSLDLRCFEFAVNGAEPIRPGTLRRFAEAFAVSGFRPEALKPVYGMAETTLMACGKRNHRTLESVFLSVSREALEQNLAVTGVDDPSDSLEVVSTGTTGDRHETIIVDPVSRLRQSEGAVGEIWFRGPSVAQGYWNRSAETENTFAARLEGDTGRYLRTGDLGFMHEGELYVTGRMKEMMIFHGRNIYPQDIEATVEGLHPAFRANGCAAFSIEGNQSTQLVVVQELELRAKLSPEGLADRIRLELAEGYDLFDIAAILVVKAGRIPRTTSGKIRRVECRALFLANAIETIWEWRSDAELRGHEKEGASGYIAPRTATEIALAGIWREVLHVTAVSITDNFFELGGHSLAATQVIARVRDVFGIELEIAALFKTPTIEALASSIDHLQQAGAATTTVAIALVGRRDLLPLSPAQQRMWFLDQFKPGDASYHIFLAVHLTGELDVSALTHALNEIVRRHEVLRTHFLNLDGAAVQVIASQMHLDVPVRDLSGLPFEEREAQSEVFKKEAALRPFDLTTGPLIRTSLIKLGRQEHRLFVTLHHIVSDGWSMGILARELGALYAAYLENLPSPLANLAIQYADFAQWQRGWLADGAKEAQTGYWTAQLAGSPALLALPTDRPRPMVQRHRGDSVHFIVPASTMTALELVGKQTQATLFMTLAAVFNVLLARYSGERDICIGTPIANRNRAEVEGVIGFFVNTLVLRTRFGDNPTFHELLQQMRETALEAYANQDVPFEHLVDVLRAQRDLSASPLFQVMLVLQDVRIGDLKLPGITLTRESDDIGVSKFDLTLEVSVEGGELHGRFEYDTDLFDAGAIDRMAGHFGRLLESATADPHMGVFDLPMLSASERDQVLYGWNETRAEYPRDKCVHQLFEQQVERTPDAVAVLFHDEELSYSELNRRSNRLAHYLRELGVGPDDRVAICVERGLEMVVGLLAVLKAGGAYVPLDPAYPRERLRFMLEDSGPVVLLTQRHLKGLFADLNPALPVLDLEDAAGPWQQLPGSNPGAAGLTSGNLAYVIYTSGSTGQPKGVMVQHQGLTNRIVWMQSAYELDRHDAVLQKTPFGFDVSVWEFFWPLATGARLVMARPEGHKDPAYLVETIRRFAITTLHFVPSMLQVFLNHESKIELPSLLRVVCSGEALAVTVAEQFQAQLPGVALYNLYGPTEATVDVTAWSCPFGEEQVRIPIGRPIWNTHVYILDGRGEPVPVGVAGELYLGGAGVARGYLNRAELTAEKFLQDPFVTEAAGRMYRTGDLGRWLVDGNIEFLGRNDDQVKIRGFRIELGEIESRLADHAGVGAAAVVAREDTPGEKRLVAYYTLAVEGEAPSTEQLRAHLGARLPEYMVPAAYVRLESLPLTPNGKLDRRVLPAPEADAYGVREYEAPVGETEIRIAAIWAEVLKLERVGRQDNFFALGGHSLLAVKVVTRLREAGVAVDVRALFVAPTVAGLAAGIGRKDAAVAVPPNLIPSGCERIRPEMLPLVELSQEEIDGIAGPGGAANVQDIYPLAPLQEGILFHHLMESEGDPYLLGGLLGFDTRARLDGYVEALQAVVARHDILRTAVLWEGLPEPVQVVLRQARVAVEEVELDAAAGDAAEQLRARFDPRRYRMDLGQAPLLHIFTGRDGGSGRWLLLLLFHHLVMDHSGLETVQAEVQAYLLGQADQLPAAIPFRDLVAQARLGGSREKDEAFFGEMLGDVEEPTLPFGLLDVRGDGRGIGEALLELDPDLARRLRGQARRLGVSAASLCHLAWGRVLGKLSGREDVVFGTVLLGRMQGGEGAGRVLGPAINTLPVRLRVGDEGVERAVRSTHALLAGLLRHEQASLALAQRCSGVAAPAPLFSALLNYRHSGAPSPAPGWEGIESLGGEERTNYPFTLSVDDLGEGFTLTAQTVASIDPGRVCGYMRTALESLTEALETSPSSAVSSLEVLSASERDQVLYGWNDTEAEYPRDKCIHQLFEQQVEKTPDAVAVVYEDRELSYAELNRRSNRLAHYLRELGVGPDDRVAICVERGLEMMVGLLAVLKAGGAYVPLDPAYPRERLRFMLEDSGPVVLLTQGHLRELFGEHAQHLPVVDLEGVPAWRVYPESNPGPQSLGLTSRHLAYVIYTSGSTGNPKGVMVQHSALTNFLWSMRQQPGIEPDDVLLSVTTLSFDIAALELYLPLTAGASVRILSRTVSIDGTGLIAELQHGITLMQATPATWRLLMEAGWEGTKGLKVLCGGEALSPGLAGSLVNQSHSTWNMYGPTETTVWSLTARLNNPVDRVTVGRPISNTHVYILDGRGEPVPVGVAGEIYIGGAGVARGYLNRAELTVEKFLRDPFVSEAGGRMYRTGDLGRWLGDGNIECLGRNDDQVKIRGFRIELGEIESRLAEHRGVGAAAVVAREDTLGEKRLVAYYTLAVQGEALRAGELRAHLSARLPEYMVPAAYVRLESLPLTPNGKLDRRALPTPDADAYGAREYEAPLGETEIRIAAIWAEVLKLERVGRQDNFFALGGHSLLAVKVVTRLHQRLGVEVGVRELFQYPVLADLAVCVELAEQAALPAIPQAGRGQHLPLSFAQQRLWFLSQMEGGSGAYHIPVALQLRGDLDRGALRRALEQIVARHEALRTTFVTVDGEPEQRIAAVEDSRFLLLEEDLRERGDAEAELQRLIGLETTMAFDLEAGPLIRGRLIRLGEREHVLLVTLHHIVSDGWSMGVLAGELSTLYAAFVRGQEDPLSPLEIQYADYALWQRQWMEGEVLREQGEYWKKTLGGAPALLEVPADYARPAQQDYRGDYVAVDLDAGLTAGLRELSRRHGVTLYMTLLAAWAALLGRLSGQQDVVVGSPAANRSRAEIEGLIGFFVNTLALRVDLSGSPTVGGLLERVKAQALGAQQHQDIPFEQVVETLQPERSLGHSPVFQAMLAWQNNEVGKLEFPGLEVRPLSSSHRVAKFDLTLSLEEVGDRIAGGLEYATALFAPGTVERYLGYFRALLQAMADDDTQTVDRLPMLSAAERHQVLYGWNETEAEYPQDKCMHQLFEEQVERTPDALAAVYEDRELSYAELNRRSNRLAHYLLELGVGPDDRVAICVERGLEMVVGLLAVLKAGGAYVPLDPAYPRERLRFMLEDSGPVALLTQGHLRELFGDHAQHLPVVDLEDARGWQQLPGSNPDPGAVGLTSLHLAYVIYTSGSTGQPKGVMVQHQGLCNLAAAQIRLFAVDAGSRVLQFASFSFDATIWDITMALCGGSCLCLAAREALLPGEPLLGTLRKYGITHLTLPPSALAGFGEGPEEDELEGRTVILAGELPPSSLIWRLQGRVTLWNAYGPTEATVCATACRGGVAGNTVAIGRPISNTHVYILDGSGEPVPVGVAGELYIGGAGVARGYLNRAELTAEKFLRDPFVSEAGGRMYRTGDLGRWLVDGNIEFLGRNDNQVKIRGFRIELGEIEAYLAAHPGVGGVAVMAREDSPGEKRLVAYYTPSPEGGEAGAGAESLRSYLSAMLPEYMVPAAYVRLESLPLTVNGKVDRRALPAPEGEAYAAARYEAPQGETEIRIAAIWAEVLKLDRVGRQDNFFALGGHSLLAVKVVTRLRQGLGVNVGVRELFLYPVLADLAGCVEWAEPVGLPAIPRAGRGQHLPLSFAQQRLWFLSQMDGGSGAYHMPVALQLKGDLDRGALRRALERIVARHEALRTTFATVDGEPEQRIAAVENSRFLLLEEDLRGRGDAEAELQRLIGLEATAAFDLEAGPLIRGRLIRLAEREHVLLVTLHHIVSDGWSMGVFAGELSTLYGAFVRGQENPLSPLEIQYADYALWQRRWMEGEVLREQGEYWKKTLGGAPVLLEVPGDYVRPAQQDYRGDYLAVDLDAGLTAGLRELSRRHGVTLYMTLLAAWAAVLGRLSGQQDVVVGSPAANRGRAEIEGLIGFFVNTLALRVDLSGSPTVGGLLERVKGQALGAQQHQDIPFEQLVEILQPERSLGNSPIFQAMLAWQNNEVGKLEFPGLEVRALSSSHRVAKFDLTLSLEEDGDRIAGGLEYATALFAPGTVERYLGYFRALLQGMAADDTQAVDRLPILSAAERDQVLYGWNEPQTEYPSAKCVHQLFEEQAERTPDVTAVVFRDEELSYAELNRRSNRLAHYLRELGVGPDDRVAICVERGLEMMVGLLAVLKAGGAYVPLDPAYPRERLRFMLEDSGPVVLLTQHHLRGLFADLNPAVPVLDLEDAVELWQQLPGSNPDPEAAGLTSGHLAYVIYTSGSTGQPKGVMVAHRNVVRLFAATDAWFQFSSTDVWTLFHSYAFDFSVWEIWGALLYGGRLLMVPWETSRSPEDFYRLLCREKVTVLNQTPSAFRQLLAAQARSAEWHSLRYVIFGGEMLEVATLKPWYRQNHNQQTHLVNMYGITETTVHVTYRRLEEGDTEIQGGSPVGCRIPDLRVYLLDGCGEPVPVGVSGELYIGGAGLARGYLNRADLTAERFLADPFTAEAGGRMYRTGDLGRWLGDGNIEFLGRNDDQVKIRGFRIELGEVESRLAEHPGVGAVVVLAREDVPGEKRLVAYYTQGKGDFLRAEELRTHLSAVLPDYMVPGAYVRLESLPLTPNGKLDGRALPAPEAEAYGLREYEAPVGEAEEKIAGIWAEVLGVERVGRGDDFFALGGHSLLAVKVIDRLRRAGLGVDVRSLFITPTVAGLAASIGGDAAVAVPPNLIPLGCERIEPAMLPLVELSQKEIDGIAGSVPGGAANVQDIYPLTPLQEGILFHHLLAGEGDPYVLGGLLGFDTRARLDGYVEALRAVVTRHDILRTAVLWEGLPEPVQVVLRQARVAVEEVELDPAGGEAGEQLRERFDPRRYRMDLGQAPLLRLFAARDGGSGRWVLLQLFHHIADDNTSLQGVQGEVRAYLRGEQGSLPTPVPFRELVAQARLGVSREEHEAFFAAMLGDVEEPTLPFGLLDVRGDGRGIEEARLALDTALCLRLRSSARRLGVSVASLCHLAWGRVLGKVSGREDVVFGTVLLGRMQGGEGAGRVLGPAINMLPLRLRVGEEGVERAVRSTHALLAGLLRHEHASLSLAQRSSGVRAPMPLFSALLNYRHSGSSSPGPVLGWEGIEFLGGEERTNYPFTLSVDDLGEGFTLTAQTAASIDPGRVCGYMRTALESLAEALETSPSSAVSSLEVLSASERHQVLYGWNETAAEYPRDKCVHQLFEAQVERTPDAVAVVYEDRELSYAELNRRSNRLAHYLRELGVSPDDRVAICVERSLEMVVGLLAVLKAGGAYVPLDPAYPRERLRFMLEDSGPVVLLTQGRRRGFFAEEAPDLPVLLLDETEAAWQSYPAANPDARSVGLTPEHLAYVIYTSGSTGIPKGVMVQLQGLCNYLIWALRTYAPQGGTIVSSSLSFDATVTSLYLPLLCGSMVRLLPESGELDALARQIKQEPALLKITPGYLDALGQRLLWEGAHSSAGPIVIGGEKLPVSTAQHWRRIQPGVRLINEYGPTETVVGCITYEIPEHLDLSAPIPIGRPISNTQIYILDGFGEPAPVGVAGELYIGGAGVARGYLNRPELTAEKFLTDPFVSEAGARMYRTGDLGRWLADGNLEFLGRNDDQVKVRGFRIELGEIESHLLEHAGVGAAVVVAREDTEGEKRLVAYYTSTEGDALSAEELRAHLSARLPDYMVPAAYVRLESLPLTPNGKLDRRALPAPEAEAFGAREYEAPVGETEERIAAIWAEVLRLTRVGRQDNFFDLGGHSLLAVQVVSRLRQIGLEIGISDLFRYPNIQLLAAGLQHRMPAAGFIPIRATGKERPLFLLHEMTGYDFYFQPLAEQINSDIPIYGLPAVDLDETQSPTVEGMATHLRRTIRSVQQNGPYRLAGWSFGGILAYEIAQQLIGEDQEVEFVGLLDTHFPAMDTYLPVLVPAVQVNDFFLFLCESIWNYMAKQEPQEMSLPLQKIAALSELKQTATSMDFQQLFSECQRENLIPARISALSAEDFRQSAVRMNRHQQALASYSAQPIPVPVHLFVAADSSDLKNPGRFLGWDAVLQPRQIQRIEVPGNHSSMMTRPHIASLGRAITDALAGTRGPHSPYRIPEERYRPDIAVQVGKRNLPPVFCIPGAGGNAVAFDRLATALGEQWPVYGLQPRGLDGELAPHSTVEAAAVSCLRAIHEIQPQGPVHLLGHSFGGWVAFETASQLHQRGRAVASLTLVDTEAPDDTLSIRQYRPDQVILELVRILEMAAKVPLAISAEELATLSEAERLKLLHSRMVRAGLMPARSYPDMLRGLVRTFGTTLRTGYRPEKIYSGPICLVLVSDSSLTPQANQLQHEDTLSMWKRWAPNMTRWTAPGNHVTVLEQPHVRDLAAWWLEATRDKFNPIPPGQMTSIAADH